MTRRIDKLTAKQQKELPAIRDEWLGHGLSTTLADRIGAVEGVNDAYRAAGLEPPPVVIWLRSPLEGLIGVEFVKRLFTAGNKGEKVRGQVWGQVRDQVRGQVRDQVRDQVWDQVRGQVGGQVRGQVGDQVRDQVRAHLSAAVWGQHDAGWLSWLDTFRHFGLKCCDRAAGLIKVAQCAGWWWPMRGVVILTERPSELSRDNEGRLHNESGPAVLYPDGWGVWAVHGVRVTQQIIERPEILTLEEIRSERNAEVRRVMVDRFGAERYLRESDAKLAHEDECGKLWRVGLEDDEDLVMVGCINSTAEPDGSFREYYLRVPPTTKTAREGIAWTFDIPEDEYVPAIQT